MIIKSGYVLIGINILTLILILIIAFLPSNFLRMFLSLPLVVFFPGYTLPAALFPRQRSLEDIERFALSLESSIAAVSLIGFAIGRSLRGIHSYSILMSLSIPILFRPLSRGIEDGVFG